MKFSLFYRKVKKKFRKDMKINSAGPQYFALNER